MCPVREGFARDDSEARKKLAHRPYCKSAGPYGHAYYGRGYVQLTHLENYEKQSEKLGIDLVKFPDRALETPVALKILIGGMLAGDFNGKGLGLAHYVNETTQDFIGARRTVNVQDRASEIANYATQFMKALTMSNLTAIDPRPAPADDDASSETGIPQDWAARELAETNTLLRAVIAKLDAAPIVAGPASPVTPIAAPLPPGVAASALLKQLGLGTVEPEKIAALLAQLETAGIILPGQNLTPVNRALGDTIGKLLNGKKTVIGIAGLLISVFLPQLAPLTTFLTNDVLANGAIVDTATSQVSVAPIQNILTPLASIFAGWGGLGKIDKWMHKPAISTVTELIAAMRK